VSLNENKFDGIIAELREQGLEVTVCSALNETWYIKDDGVFTGYIASGAELLELKRVHKLNIRGIKSLG
jgi:predicted peroxiredoxin